MLTRAHAEVTDVAAAAVSDGFVVGWINDQSGHPEVYAAKVDFKLARRFKSFGTFRTN